MNSIFYFWNTPKNYCWLPIHILGLSYCTRCTEAIDQSEGRSQSRDTLSTNQKPPFYNTRSCQESEEVRWSVHSKLFSKQQEITHTDIQGKWIQDLFIVCDWNFEDWKGWTKATLGLENAETNINCQQHYDLGHIYPTLTLK